MVGCKEGDRSENLHNICGRPTCRIPGVGTPGVTPIVNGSKTPSADIRPGMGNTCMIQCCLNLDVLSY